MVDFPCIRIATAAALALIVGGAAAADAALERAVLRGDWSALARPGADAAGSPGVTAMLRGHAGLALNRNDESVCLFAAADEAAAQAWDAWTEGLLARHGAEPLAYYFRGDALARRGWWPQAIDQFDRGLALDAGHVLLRNARGVAQAVGGHWAEATIDLDAAARAGGLADTFANQGVVALLQGQSAVRVAERFDQALSLAPRFALAHAGRAMARLALGRADEARGDADAAIAAGDCLPGLIGQAVARALAEFDDRERRRTADEDDTDPGVSLVTHLGAVRRGDMGGVDRLAGIVGKHPELAPMVQKELRSLVAENPGLGPRIAARVEAGRDHYARSGPAQAAVGLLKGLSVTAELALSQAGARPSGLTTAGAKVGLAVSFAELAKVVDRGNEQRRTGYEQLAPPPSRPGIWPTGPIGGASSNASRIRWDLGDGPRLGEFGLLYRRPDAAPR